MRSSPRPKLHILLTVVVVLSMSLGLFLSTNLISHATSSDSWSIVPSPSPGGGIYCYPANNCNDLFSVAAISSNDVWAAGEYLDSNGFHQTLIEHWDGTTWNVAPSPSPSPYNNQLLGITAIAYNDVWAVGRYTISGGDQTLTEHWDGSTWSVVPSPSPGGTSCFDSPGCSELVSVAAVSSNDVWAVGGYELNNGTGNIQPLIEHWDGSAWSVVPSPNLSPNINSFGGVAAIASNDVWAVGSTFASNGYAQTLTEHWNGSTWSVVPSPNPTSINDYLSAVAAVSSSDIWTVGEYELSDGSGNHQTLTEHWDGSTWSVVPSPNPTSLSFLAGVAVISSNDVWTVGESYDGSSSNYKTITEQWDGTNWNVITSPNVVTDDNHLYGVAAISSSDVWTVGYYSPSTSGDQTLIEHYGPTLTPRISNITLTVTPSTPLYHVEVDVRLLPQNIACPAALTLTLGPISSTMNDVCNGTQTAPAVVPFVLPVFNPDDSSQDLSPASATTASANIVDQNGQDQHSATVTTPPVPIWVGVGDSYSSGHHQIKSFRNCPFGGPIVGQICYVYPNDPTFSWVPQAVTQVNTQLQVPAAWHMQVDLLAQSGKTTTQIVANQVPTMETDLTTHAGSWNVVSLDGGANDINFAGQLYNFYLANRKNTLVPWNITNSAQCVDTNALAKTLVQMSQTISKNLNTMVADAHLFDPNARIVDMEYPYVMDTTNICSKNHSVFKGGTLQFVLGAQAVVDNLDNLHQQLLGNQIIHLDLRATFGANPMNEVQQTVCWGYPHPNAAGQQDIASLAATDVINFTP